MLKKILIILILAVSLLPSQELNAQSSNAGFVPGNIWYSKDPFEEKDKIKIYTLVFNPDPKELSGTVSFFDRSTLLGKKNFVVEGLGVQDISIDWVATAGDHVIFAKIENAKFLTEDGDYENVILAKSETEESRRTVAKKIVIEEAEDDEDDVVLDTDVIKKVILEKTPNFISEPIVASVNVVEEWRQDSKEAITVKKDKTKEEIKVLEEIQNTDDSETPTAEKESKSQLEKPFKQTKLFFLNILSMLLDNMYAFYGSGALIAFFLGRYILRLIF